MKRKYKSWKNHHYSDLVMLYKMLGNKFKNIKYISKTEWESIELFDKFCKLIYDRTG